MKTLGFTGTRNTEVHQTSLLAMLDGDEMQMLFDRFEGFVTGGCKGWDALVGEYLATKLPLKTHTVVVPANTTQVDAWWLKPGFEHVRVFYMPEGTSYRDRNVRIVDLSDEIFYCADYTELHPKSKRSGTWMTVRIAHRRMRPVFGVTLNSEAF